MEQVELLVLAGNGTGIADQRIQLHNKDFASNWNSNLEDMASNSTLLGGGGLQPERSYRIEFNRKSYFQVSFDLLSTFINFTILFVIVFNRKFRKRTNYLIANLCLASCLHNGVLIYRFLEYKLNLNLCYEDGWLCGVFAVLHRFSLPVMSMTTMAISLERSQSATATLPAHLLPSKTWTALKILGIWVLSLLLTLPTAFINVYDPASTIMSPRRCRKILLFGSTLVHLAYVFLHVTIVYVVPTAVLVNELIRIRTKIKFLIFRQVEITARTDDRLRLVRNACLFTAVFIIFWLPIGLHATVYDLPQEIVTTKWKQEHLVSGKNLQFITHYFVFSIPILLFILSQSLREALCGCFQRQGDSESQQQQQQEFNQHHHRLPAPPEEHPGGFPLTSYLCYLYYCCDRQKYQPSSNLELEKL